MKIVIAAFAALCLAGTALSAQAAGQLREEEQEGIGVTGKRAQVDTEKPAQTTTTSSAHQSEVKKMELDEIKVRDTRENAFVETKGTQPYTESTITKEGIKIIGGPGQSSVIKVLDVLPSVNVESFDPYGLNRQGRFLRIRGQGAMSIDYSLEGIPVDAGAGARTQENAFDMENFSGVTLYKGASPVDQGFGWGNSGGTVNMSILKPLDKAGLTVSQSAGSFNFFRTFVRADTGEILPHLKSFLSYSYTETDKWKGEGGVDRNHVTFDTVFSPSSMVNAQLNFDYNTSDSHSYRSLSYAQSKDLRTNYEYDFNKRITGVAKEDIYYYDFNKVNDDYLLLFGNVRIQPADNHTVTIKPYFSRSHSLNYGNLSNYNGSPAIYEWAQDRTEFGGIIDYKTSFFNTDLSIGYWVEMMKWPGYTSKAYTISTTGALTFAGWEKALMQYDGWFTYQTPYISLSKTLGRFNATVGLKYFRFSQPKTIAYTNTGVPDVSTDDVFNYAKVDEKASVGEKTTDALLPSAAFSYALNEHVTPYINYGRGYTLAYLGGGGFTNAYWSNKAVLDKIGITADMLADRANLPIADNFDLGVRLKFGTWNITPTVFYSHYDDKNVTVIDPETGIQFKQTVGKARAYGAELEIAGSLFDSVSLFASGSYNTSEFTKDVPSKSGTIDISGNQFPDTPQYMAKLGVTYMPPFAPGFQVSPIIRCVGSRYADAENKYKVPGYVTADFNVTYTLKNVSSFLKDLTVGFYIGNIFDKEYIASISAADEARQTAATYYPGAPRTFAGSISGRF